MSPATADEAMMIMEVCEGARNVATAVADDDWMGADDVTLLIVTAVASADVGS